MATLGVYLAKRDFVVIATVWFPQTANIWSHQDLSVSDSHIMSHHSNQSLQHVTLVCHSRCVFHVKATSTLVFGNLSNFVVVFEGIVFFSDPVFEAPLVFTGIALSLLGGIWYAMDQSDLGGKTQDEAPGVSTDP